MKIVLIGASGYVGSAILAEALQRGHDVTALVRNISLEDYAMAMLDELERPAHPRQRFTAGY